eukprot:UC1_evm1s1319
MVVCTEAEAPTAAAAVAAAQRKASSSSKSKGNKNKERLWPHGLTPPLKNVRKKRWRKTAARAVDDLADVEEEVQRLLRADEEAIESTYEMIVEGGMDHGAAADGGGGGGGGGDVDV